MNTKNGAHAPTGSACLEKVLERLDKVRSNGAGKWMACCPAHPDQNPSLSIREATDGRVLIHCWAGCETRDVMAAIGFEMRDLFPGDKRLKRGPSKAALFHERCIYNIGVSTSMRGVEMSPADHARFKLACKRLGVKHE
ncbi:MAG TPA: virulence-associated protein E [Pseudomonas sabulinigri]|uniref:Zinc finger CHC2-type domain-containing protein n=1 Tax=marine sediment metagenome TaxID=412755 RepID=A0A0F9VVB5_9ZZZZ|nr:virulence-associated protein E [Halopseudomonas sabulinigri]HEC51966.1 virulence-associated protein E [Halopseudomonas sabulinigri]